MTHPATITLPAALSFQLLRAITRFADDIMAKREPNEVIYRRGVVCFDRWYLARKVDFPTLVISGEVIAAAGFMPGEMENLYLHRFANGDDEAPHCHPWGNATLLLTGEYYEDEFDQSGALVGARRRGPGDVVIRPASVVHRIHAVQPGTVSLFATLPKERDWGFYTEAGFVPWRRFHAERVSA